MAAAAALNVVKQIQALAEGPQTQEMRQCLGQVVTSLLFLLDHPDSRVRLNAARALLTLSKGYGEDIRNLDLSRGRSALARCRKAMAEGNVESDVEELEGLLAQVLGEERPAQSVPRPEVAKSTCVASSVSAAEARGEIVLKVGHQVDTKEKAAIRQKVVTIVGVVS